MHQDVDFRRLLSTNGAGKPVLGDPIPAKCYMVQKDTAVINSGGISVHSDTQLYFICNQSFYADITTKDYIVLNSKERPMQALEKIQDGNANLKAMVVYL